MALKINTNSAAISALRNLQSTERSQARSMLRLSTGLRINNAGDDPSGLVIANKMRSQVAGLEQVLENTRRDRNMLQTADSALAEIETIIDDIRQSVLFALNGGASDSDQIAAEQTSVDQAITAINRIANTTRFGNVNLLDGSHGQVTSSVTAGILRADVRNVSLNNPATSQVFRITVANSATGALFSLGAAFAPQAAEGLLRITGNLGSELVALGSTAIAAQVQSAIAGVRFQTGVRLSGTMLVSDGFGTDQFVRVELVSGAFATGFGAGSPSGSTEFGQDIVAYVNGVAAGGKGREIQVNGAQMQATILMSTGGGTFDFRVGPRAGLRLQLNDGPGATGSEQLGLRGVDAGSLGDPNITLGGVSMGGLLANVLVGGASDLATDASRALRIVDGARDQLADIRAFIGSFMQNVLDANESAVSVQHENLSSAESDIRDLDFAAETTEFTKNQILFQAGTAVLAQANLIPQTVLALLQ